MQQLQLSMLPGKAGSKALRTAAPLLLPAPVIFPQPNSCRKSTAPQPTCGWVLQAAPSRGHTQSSAATPKTQHTTLHVCTAFHLGGQGFLCTFHGRTGEFAVFLFVILHTCSLKKTR